MQSTCAEQLAQSTCAEQPAQSTCAKRLHGATGAEQLAQTNLRRAHAQSACTEQLAQSTCAEKLAQSTCAEQLAQSTCVQQLAESNLRAAAWNTAACADHFREKSRGAVREETRMMRWSSHVTIHIEHRRVQTRSPQQCKKVSPRLDEHLGKNAFGPIADRASQAIAKLSATTVQEALASRNPWQSLKAAASRPATRFRWIPTDELNNHIATQAQREHGAFISNAKQKKLKSDKKARHQSELQISPEHLVIPTGTFVDDQDEPLQQIPASEVGANRRRGIAILPATEANRFLADGISISIDALALLTTTELPVSLAGLTTEAIRFPALYTGTDEPVLLTGTLIQLGDVSVKHIQPANQPLEDEPDLCIFRISVFKDELPHDWPDFIKAPLRNVIRATTCLQFCQDDAVGPDPISQWAPSGTPAL